MKEMLEDLKKVTIRDIVTWTIDQPISELIIAAVAVRGWIFAGQLVVLLAKAAIKK